MPWPARPSAGLTLTQASQAVVPRPHPRQLQHPRPHHPHQLAPRLLSPATPIPTQRAVEPCRLPGMGWRVPQATEYSDKEVIAHGRRAQQRVQRASLAAIASLTRTGEYLFFRAAARQSLDLSLCLIRSLLGRGKKSTRENVSVQ